MNDITNNILFWISFVGFTLFVIRGVYATILLRLQKDKEYQYSEFGLTMLAATLSIIFASLAISTNHQHINATPPTSNTRIELHQKIGEIILYDPQTGNPDTVTIFREIKSLGE